VGPGQVGVNTEEVELGSVSSPAEEGSASSFEMTAYAKEPYVQISDAIHPPHRMVAERRYTHAVHLLGDKSKFNKFKSMKFIIQHQPPSPA
jgi:hypothetical protein